MQNARETLLHAMNGSLNVSMILTIHIYSALMLNRWLSRHSKWVKIITHMT